MQQGDQDIKVHQILHIFPRIALHKPKLLFGLFSHLNSWRIPTLIDATFPSRTFPSSISDNRLASAPPSFRTCTMYSPKSYKIFRPWFSFTPHVTFRVELSTGSIHPLLWFHGSDPTLTVSLNPFPLIFAARERAEYPPPFRASINAPRSRRAWRHNSASCNQYQTPLAWL